MCSPTTRDEMYTLSGRTHCLIVQFLAIESQGEDRSICLNASNFLLAVISRSEFWYIDRMTKQSNETGFSFITQVLLF